MPLKAPEIRLIGLRGVPEIKPYDDLPSLIVQAAGKNGIRFRDGDVLVVTQKVVSKAEGRLLKLDRINPSPLASSMAKILRKDARVVELVLRETRRIVRMTRGIIIVETRHGFVCANAGVDQSNVENGFALLLPLKPDKSAENLRNVIRRKTGAEIGVIISDTFGRPWREGQVDVAVGVAGVAPLIDYRGLRDKHGYQLKATIMAAADELASAAELVMEKLSGVPAVVVRGFKGPFKEGSSRELVRPWSRDLFR